jgi:RNA polymerase sigma-70 factor (ECF subfamily)
MLRRTLGPQAEVEQLLQQAFVRVVEQLGTLPESAQLRPFVVAVTARLLTAELRRHRMRRLLRLRSPWSSVDVTTSADGSARAALAALYDILDQLDADARLAFTLRHFEGLPITELASATDSSVSSAKRRLARASLRVQAALGRDTALKAYATAVSLGDTP